VLLYKIRWSTKSKKRELCQLPLVMLCSLFCLHMMISRCRPWFGSAWSNSEQSGLARSASLFLDNLTHLNATFKELSCIRINTVFNRIWTTTVPAMWRKAITLPSLTAKTPNSTLSSYWPISLQKHSSKNYG